MRLIGLIGRARVGKDTVAGHLCSYHGFSQYAFADPIKDMLEVVFGHIFRSGDREQPIEWLGKSPRQLMQSLGTEWGRQQVHPELWVKLGEQVVNFSTVYDQSLVISDVRFHEEADMILRQGGELWQVVRDGVNVNDHPSEQTRWDDYDLRTLNNNGTLDQLYRNIDLLMAERCLIL